MAAPALPYAIRTAQEADVPHIAGVLAAAFHNDDVSVRLFPNPSTRHGIHLGFMGAAALWGLEAGQVDVVESNDNRRLLGAAIWLPGEASPPEWFGTAIEKATGKHYPQLAALLQATDAGHPHEPHDYLMFAGVTGRTKGTGTDLLARHLQETDRLGLPTYLEASSVRSRLGIYTRLGYVSVGETGEIVVPNDGPTLYPMWRDVPEIV